MGLGAAGIGLSRYQAAKEIQNIRTTTERLSAAIVSGNIASGEAAPVPIGMDVSQSEGSIVPPNTRGYFFAMTGEILYLPKTWHEMEMPAINKQLAEMYRNSDNGITLGEIRFLIGLRDNINIDDLLYFPLNYAGRFDPPQLEVKLPIEFHGRGIQQDNMLEIHITGFMAVDDSISLL
jgi:hypothetical protein